MRAKFLAITLSLLTCFSSLNAYAVENTATLATDDLTSEVIETAADTIEEVAEPVQEETALTTNPTIETDVIDDNSVPEENSGAIDNPGIDEQAEQMLEDYSEWVGRSETEVREHFSDSAIYKYEITDNVDPGIAIRIEMENESLVIYLSEKQVDVEEEIVKEDASLLSHYELATCRNNPPAMSDDTWNGYPVSYEYNWDNSGGCWYWGMWGGNGNLQGYTCQENTYDTNVRHAMSLYCDGSYVYLHVIYASCFDNPGNGNDYNFAFDEANAKFRVVYNDGADLTSKREEGSYKLKVIHGDGSISGQDVIGASGTMVVKPNNNNNEMEIKIPIEECARQNSMINTKSFCKVTFFTPNLMYRKISCGGAGNSALPFVFGTITLFAAGSVIYANKRKKDRRTE